MWITYKNSNEGRLNKEKYKNGKGRIQKLGSTGTVCNLMSMVLGNLNIQTTKWGKTDLEYFGSNFEPNVAQLTLVWILLLA